MATIGHVMIWRAGEMDDNSDWKLKSEAEEEEEAEAPNLIKIDATPDRAQQLPLPLSSETVVNYSFQSG